MRYEMILAQDGPEETLQISSEPFKKWIVWKVQFKEGQEAVLFKCGNVWLQRNEDNLDPKTLAAIGQQIDSKSFCTVLSKNGTKIYH